MPRRSSPRLVSFDYTGVRSYSLTCCTFQRLPIFASADSVAGVLDAIRLAADEKAFVVVAYCFTPDHLHLLVSGERATSELRGFVERAKQRSAYWYWQRTRRRLWQRSYWDRVLRYDEAVADVMRYILANPVRAGLVSHPGDYPFSGSCTYDRQALMAVWDDPQVRGSSRLS